MQSSEIRDACGDLPRCSLQERRHHLMAAPETMLQESLTKLNLNLIKPLHLTSSVQEVQGQRVHVRLHREMQAVKSRVRN